MNGNTNSFFFCLNICTQFHNKFFFFLLVYHYTHNNNSNNNKIRGIFFAIIIVVISFRLLVSLIFQSLNIYCSCYVIGRLLADELKNSRKKDKKN